MKTLRYFTTVATIGILVACQNDDLDLCGYASDPDAVRITATVGDTEETRSNPAETIGSDKAKQFVAGDRISVTILNDNQSTVVYRLSDDEATWTPENGYLKWNQTTHTFLVYYPADIYSGNQNVPVDQSTLDKLALADYMRFGARKTKDETKTVSFQMTRQTARIVIDASNIIWQGEYKDSDGNVTHELTDISVCCEKVSNIDMYKDASQKYYALVNPCSALSDKAFVTLTIKSKTDDSTKSYTIHGIPELIANMSYTYHITIGKNAVHIANVTVADWGDGDLIGDDVNMTEELK